MKLTNPIKKELALDIVAAAAAKHAGELMKSASKLHGLWVDAFKAHARLLMPDVPESSWAALIQEGLARSVQSHGGLSVTKYEPLEQAPFRATTNELEFGQVYPKQPTDRLRTIVGRIRTAFPDMSMFSVHARDREIEVGVSPQNKCAHIPGAACVSRLDFRGLDAGAATRLGLKSPGQEGVNPNFNPTDVEKAWFNLASPLYEQTVRLGKMYLKVFTEAEKHHAELTHALAAVSSVKQLIELFPEAEQFLPAPPPPKSKIVPANLFANARKMLEEGIPT